MMPPELARVFDGVSKAALVDALYCACVLGTDESLDQIAAKMARELSAALEYRGDRPASPYRKALERLSAVRIESDPTP